MKEIALTQGKVALVDDEDFEKLNQHKWSTLRCGRMCYAHRAVRRVHFKMHRVVMNPTPEQEVDHINRNGLDNQKGNLRVCSTADNRRNVGLRADNRSGFKGVSWHKQHRKWYASTSFNGKRTGIGLFGDPVRAALAYNEAARKLHGEFAYENPVSSSS